MSRSRTRRCAGFTMFEVMIVISLTALALTSLTEAFSTNHELAEDTRARQKAEGAHRRNLVALSRVLRGVDLRSLSGFDAQGMSTAPRFGRVTGADLTDLTYAGEEQLVWMPYPVAVDGVEKPGAVYLVRDGQRSLAADRVPAGGFYVRQEGQSLVIHLTTFYATHSGRVVQQTSDTAISVRN